MTKTVAPSKKATRQSNIELLRVLSMILIVLYHLSHNATAENFVDDIFLTGLTSWGILGVNIFVAISSYFLLEQKFKLSRIVSVFVQMATYSIVFLIIRLVYDYVNLGTPVLSNFIELELQGLSAPFWVTRYWFVWIYMLLCVFAPFLNLFIEKLSRSNHIKLLVCMSFILLYGTFGNGIGLVVDFAYFVYIYLFVAYLKEYPLGFIEKNAVWGSLIMAVALVVSRVALSFLGIIGDMVSSTLFSTNRHSAYMVFMALFVFCAFKNMKMKQSRFINFLALQTLGIYLFHENLLFNVSDLLYVKLDSMWDMPASLLCVIAAVILFVSGSAVEFVRRKLLDKPVTTIVGKSKLVKKIDTLMDISVNS